MNLKHQWIAKLALLIAWPLIAALLAACIAFVLFMAWVLIPFGRIKRKPDGGLTMDFPWDD